MSYDIVIITHPPFFKYLPELLKSLRNNSAGSVKLYSSLTNSVDSRKLKSILKKYYFKNNLDLKISSSPSTIAKSRTMMAKKCSSDWVVFIDSDIILEKSYFSNLKKILPSLDSDVVAIAGGIDINLSTKYGFWEGYGDMKVYYNGVLDTDKSALSFVNKGVNSIRENVLSLKNKNTKYLQGFNHILRKSYLEKNSFYDLTFWSAEDREMACAIRSKNYKIVLYPELLVFHNYTFSLRDIMRRKRIHGYWYTKLRKKYPREDLVPQLTPKLLFNFIKTIILGKRVYVGFRGGLYIRLASLAYLIGILEAKTSSFKFSGGWKYGR